MLRRASQQLGSWQACNDLHELSGFLAPFNKHPSTDSIARLLFLSQSPMVCVLWLTLTQHQTGKGFWGTATSPLTVFPPPLPKSVHNMLSFHIPLKNRTENPCSHTHQFLEPMLYTLTIFFSSFQPFPSPYLPFFDKKLRLLLSLA